MTPSGHQWIQGQGSGPRLTEKGDDEEDKFDAMVSQEISIFGRTGLTLISGQQDRRQQKGEEAHFLRAAQEEEGAHGPTQER